MIRLTSVGFRNVRPGGKCPGGNVRIPRQTNPVQYVDAQIRLQ